jgi:hypothetical protein
MGDIALHNGMLHLGVAIRARDIAERHALDSELVPYS